MAELAQALGAKTMPLYRGTNERGAVALGIAGWDSLEGIDTLLSWGPPPTAGVPAERPLPCRLGLPAEAGP